MPVTVRKARKEDADAVAGYALKLFKQHREYDPKRFAKVGNLEGAKNFYGSQTETDDAAVLVAELDGHVVGFAYLAYEAMNYADLLKSAVWLHDIYIDESARGSGAGRLLIDAAREAAREFGADKIVLHVAAKNSLGREFFGGVGFQTTMLEMMLEI